MASDPHEIPLEDGEPDKRLGRRDFITKAGGTAAIAALSGGISGGLIGWALGRGGIPVVGGGADSGTGGPGKTGGTGGPHHTARPPRPPHPRRPPGPARPRGTTGRDWPPRRYGRRPPRCDGAPRCHRFRTPGFLRSAGFLRFAGTDRSAGPARPARNWLQPPRRARSAGAPGPLLDPDPRFTNFNGWNGCDFALFGED